MHQIKGLTGFPQPGIPSIFDESQSYTQQVAYLMYKIQECIDLINEIEEQSSGLPETTAADNGKILEVVEGVWNKTNTAITLAASVNTLTSGQIQNSADIAILQSQMNDILGDLIQLTATLTAINQGAVDLEEE